MSHFPPQSLLRVFISFFEEGNNYLLDMYGQYMEKKKSRGERKGNSCGPVGNNRQERGGRVAICLFSFSHHLPLRSSHLLNQSAVSQRPLLPNCVRCVFFVCLCMCVCVLGRLTSCVQCVCGANLRQVLSGTEKGGDFSICFNKQNLFMSLKKKKKKQKQSN